MAADHGGYEAKQQLSAWLQEQGYQVLDAGAKTYDADDDYSAWAQAAVKQWQQLPEAKIIAWCKSGTGMNIALNRAPGVYATIGWDPEQLAAAVADDHVNALALPAEYIDVSTQKALIDVFLSTKGATAERFVRRLAAVENIGKREYGNSTSDFTSGR